MFFTVDYYNSLTLIWFSFRMFLLLLLLPSLLPINSCQWGWPSISPHSELQLLCFTNTYNSVPVIYLTYIMLWLHKSHTVTIGCSWNPTSPFSQSVPIVHSCYSYIHDGQNQGSGDIIVPVVLCYSNNNNSNLVMLPTAHGGGSGGGNGGRPSSHGGLTTMAVESYLYSSSQPYPSVYLQSCCSRLFHKRDDMIVSRVVQSETGEETTEMENIIDDRQTCTFDFSSTLVSRMHAILMDEMKWWETCGGVSSIYPHCFPIGSFVRS